MICQREKRNLSKGKTLCFFGIGMLLVAQTVSARDMVDFMNPRAAQPGGWGGLSVGASGYGVGYNGQPGEGVDVRKALVQVQATRNRDLAATDMEILRKYQDAFSTLLAAPVPPFGVDMQGVQMQFMRVQLALSRDPMMLNSDEYSLPSRGPGGSSANATQQKIQAIVNKWLLVQGNKIPSASSLASDRQILAAASMIPELHPTLKDQVEVALLQIDAAQLRLLNAEIERADFEAHLLAFRKAMLVKSQNPRAGSSASSSRIVDLNWLLERTDAYAELMGRISERALSVTVSGDLRQSIKSVEKRARDNLTKLEGYQKKFVEIVESPGKRVNLPLQGEVEKVFAALSKLGNLAELLKNKSTITTYEATLKRALSSYRELDVDISAIEIRTKLQDMQKAQAILAFGQLRTFEKKVNDLIAKYGVMPIGAGVTSADKDLAEDNLPDEEDEANEQYEKAKIELEQLEESEDPVNNAAIKTAKEKKEATAKALKEVRGRLENTKRLLGVQNKNLGAERSSRKESETKAIHGALNGVMEAMHQLAQETLEGAFVLGDSFGSGDVTDEMARDLIRRINEGVIGLGYEPAVSLHKQLLGQAKGAEKRVRTVLSKKGEALNVKALQEDLKHLKLALIYGVGDADLRGNIRSMIAEANTALLQHLVTTDLAELEAKSKFNKKMENTAFAISTLDRLEKLIAVDDTQGPGRKKALEFIDLITASLDRNN